MMNRLPSRHCLTHTVALFIVAAFSVTVRATPYQAVFAVDPASSSLTVQASALGFSDADTQSLDGTINATFDFGTSGFGPTADLTITGASVTSLADYNLNLGFPPILGLAIKASGLVASVSTDSPPAIMYRTPMTDAEYTVSASRFPITVNQGDVVATGLISESFSLADNPVAGTSPAATMLTLLFATEATEGPYTRINATLNLPVEVSDSFTNDDGVTIDVRLTATVVATTSFDANLTGDFDGDGDVDGRDFLVWQRDTSVGKLADWQANYGTGVAASGVAVPEPSSGMIAVLLITQVLFFTRSLGDA